MARKEIKELSRESSSLKQDIRILKYQPRVDVLLPPRTSPEFLCLADLVRKPSFPLNCAASVFIPTLTGPWLPCEKESKHLAAKTATGDWRRLPTPGWQTIYSQFSGKGEKEKENESPAAEGPSQADMLTMIRVNDFLGMAKAARLWPGVKKQILDILPAATEMLTKGKAQKGLLKGKFLLRIWEKVADGADDETVQALVEKWKQI